MILRDNSSNGREPAMLPLKTLHQIAPHPINRQVKLRNELFRNAPKETNARGSPNGNLRKKGLFLCTVYNINFILYKYYKLICIINKKK